MAIGVTDATAADLEEHVPEELRALDDPQKAIPAIAKDREALALIADAVQRIPTHHQVLNVDAREMTVEPASVHLVLTSPPYWTLKQYRESEGQLGHLVDY